MRDNTLDKVFEENVDFWERAWGMVKTPYSQMPDLPYIYQIPDLLSKAPGKRVLDLGCGSGWLSVYLAKQGFSVTGADISHSAIELAQKLAKIENVSIELSVADISSLKFATNSFDAVVANSIFEHLTYDLSVLAIKSLQNCLVTNGLFYGCFDKVGGGPGQYYELSDQTHVYTDKGRKGMLLRYFSDDELKKLFSDWQLLSFSTIESGSRLLLAANQK
jgi:SAM-dependent methyltransferase